MKFLKFLFVGGCTASLQMIALWTCLHALRLTNQIAVLSAYVVAVIFHYFANRYFTFQMKKELNFKEIVRYVSLVFFNYLITFFVTTFAMDVFHFSAYVGTVFSIMITVGVTFLLSHFWVFKTRNKTSLGTIKLDNC